MCLILLALCRSFLCNRSDVINGTITCPAGFWCGTGMLDAVPCENDLSGGAQSLCPEGSKGHPRTYNEIILAVLCVWLPVVLVLSFLHWQLSLKRHHVRELFHHKTSHKHEHERPHSADVHHDRDSHHRHHGRMSRFSLGGGVDIELDEEELHEIDDLRAHILDLAHDLEGTLVSSGSGGHARHHRKSSFRPRQTALSRLTINPHHLPETSVNGRPTASFDERSEGSVRGPRPSNACATHSNAAAGSNRLAEDASEQGVKSELSGKSERSDDGRPAPNSSNEAGGLNRIAEASASYASSGPWERRRARQQALYDRRMSRVSRVSRASNRWAEQSLAPPTRPVASRVSRSSNRWAERRSLAEGSLGFGFLRKRPQPTVVSGTAAVDTLSAESAAPTPPASPPSAPPPDASPSPALPARGVEASKPAATASDADATSEGTSDASFEAEHVELSILGISKREVPVRLEWRELTFDIKASKVLTNLSGHVLHGEMTALMGESGSGKSTLLNVIGGRAVSGRRWPLVAHAACLHRACAVLALRTHRVPAARPLCTR